MPLSKIMMVDDGADIRRIAQLSLGRVGQWQVVLASSGAEACTLARVERPDAILLDVMMPELDGPATLARLRADPAVAAIPVIFLTAAARPEEVDALLRLGAAGVITKPFDPMTLPAQIRTLLGGDAS